MNITVQELAHKVLDLLDNQQQYFTTRSPLQLGKCKNLEGRMRQLCRTIIGTDDEDAVLETLLLFDESDVPTGERT